MKKGKYFLFTFILILLSISVVFASNLDYGKVCADFTEGVGGAVRILGHILGMVKVIVPVIIIVWGMVEFGKAAISTDDKAMDKAVGGLTRRIIASLIILFAPKVISVVLDITGITGGIEDNTRYGACTQCILNASEKCPL